MYKSQFEGVEADRKLALIDDINDQLCPESSGTLPLTIDSIGGNLSDWTIYGNAEGVGKQQIVNGNLPLNFVSDGSNLENYRIYGTAGGSGVSTITGYNLPLTVTSGTESKDTVIPIGDTKLMAGDYIDYKSGKIYKAKRVHEDTVTIDGIEWDILDYDHDEVYKADGTRAKHTVTIQTHDCIDSLQYSAKQAAFAFPNGLAAGAYHFTVGEHPWVTGDVNKVLTFTLANAIPSGGQLVFNGAYNKTLVGTTISAFTSPTSTTASETITMTEGSTGTDLGTILRSKTDTINSIDRALRGSNNWLKSAIRPYLNSDKTAGNVWTPQTVFDRPPTWAAATAGFLNGKSANFISHIGTAKKTTGLNNISDGGGAAVHDEKLFLLSRSEVYMGDEYAGGEGTPYVYYSEYSDLSPAGTGADTNRIKYNNSNAITWWLRSALSSSSVGVRYVDSSGEWKNNRADTERYVAPACCIVLDDADDWVKQTFYTENTIDLPAIETFSGENTIDSTETVGETTITQGYIVPLDVRSISETNEITLDGSETTTSNGVTYTVDKETGTITANGTAGEGNSAFMIYIYGLTGDFLFSGTPEDGSIDTYFSLMIYPMGMPCNKWDGTPLTENDFDYGVGMHEVRLDTPHANYMIVIKAGYTCNNLVFKPTLIRADISSHKDICTGSTPLTEGQSVSRDSTGIEIEVEQGTSVIETTLTNKPEMDAKIDRIKMIEQALISMQSSGGYNETQTESITDQVTEVTQ